MLAGIGGRTIAEAQRNILYSEFMIWVKYRDLRGSFNLGMRTEVAVARLAMLFANSKRKPGTQPFTVNDFAPHLDEPVMDLQTAMEQWK